MPLALSKKITLKIRAARWKQSRVIKVGKEICKQYGHKLPNANRVWKGENPKAKLIEYLIKNYEAEMASVLEIDVSQYETADQIRVRVANEKDISLAVASDPDIVTTPPNISDQSNGSDIFNDGFIDEIVRRVQEKAVNHEQVDQIVKQAVEKAIDGRPVQKVLVDKSGTVIKEMPKVTSKYFKQVVEMATTEDVNVCMVGPAGCGKTFLAKQVAESLEMNYVSVSITAGVSEGNLTGWLLPIGASGKFLHVDSVVLKAWQDGNSLILIDEMDAGDPNTLLIANQMLANGYMFLPMRHEEPEVKRGENVIVLAAMNTNGTGANMQYSGRNQLDQATLNRFFFVMMDYDSALERELIQGVSELHDWAEQVRKKISEYKIARPLSTRQLKGYANLMKKQNWTMSKVESNYFCTWSADEKRKVVAA